MSENYTPHGFNPQIAELYSVNAALIYRYLTFRTDGGRWVNPTLADLQALYPYMGEWQIWAALKLLTNSGKTNPALVMRKFVNGSYLYRPIVPDSCRSPHTFDVTVAMKVGVVPAIMFHNIGHWIRENWKRRAHELYTTLDPEEFDFDEYQMQRHAYQLTRGAAAHYTSAAEWVEQHPYANLKTVKRGFVQLQNAGLLRKGIRKRYRQLWHLTRPLLNKFEQEMLSKSLLEDSGAKTQNKGTKPKPSGQNPKQRDKTQSKSRLSDCPEDGSEAVEEAVLEETSPLKKQIADNSDAFLPPSLANARASVVTTSTGSTPSATRWSTPNLPKRRPTNKYVRRVKVPNPDDPEYYEYLDSLSLEERLALGS